MLASRISSAVRRQMVARLASKNATNARNLSSVARTSQTTPTSLAESSLSSFASTVSQNVVTPQSSVEVLYFNDGFSTALKFEEAWDELNQEDILECVKRTYQPNWKKRKAKHGFLARNATVAGRRLNKRRALAGRRISI